MVSRRLSVPRKFLADICSQVKIRVVLVVGSCMNSQKRLPLSFVCVCMPCCSSSSFTVTGVAVQKRLHLLIPLCRLRGGLVANH